MSTIVGTILTVVALAIVLGIYCWSARIIDTIHGRGLDTLRRIRKEIGHGRGKRSDD